jgi:hypothetical protein
MSGEQKTGNRELWSADDLSHGLNFLPASPGTPQVFPEYAHGQPKAVSEVVPVSTTQSGSMEQPEPVEIKAAPQKTLTKRKRSLADRVGRSSPTRSAMDVLKDQQPPSVKPVQQQKARASLSPAIEIIASREKAEAFVSELFGPVTVSWVGVVRDVATSQVLWRSHKARALATGDGALALAAAAMCRLMEDSTPDRWVILRVDLAGVDHAVWVDLITQNVVVAVEPAEVYLSGLSSVG